MTTGNHDLYNRRAALFKGANYYQVPAVYSEQFRKMYEDFGYDEAFMSDRHSLIYVCEGKHGIYVIVLDANGRDKNCYLSDATIDWAEDCLKKIKKKKGLVISICKG